MRPDLRQEKTKQNDKLPVQVEDRSNTQVNDQGKKKQNYVRQD